MSVELLVDLSLSDIEEDAFIEYLGADSGVYPLPNPIEKLRSFIIEPITPYNIVPIAINCMWLVEQHTIDANRRQKIDLCVMLLQSFPELNDEQHLFHSLVEKLYRAVDNRRLEQLRLLEDPRCCVML
jgi:hypothetical protein